MDKFTSHPQRKDRFACSTIVFFWRDTRLRHPRSTTWLSILSHIKAPSALSDRRASDIPWLIWRKTPHWRKLGIHSSCLDPNVSRPTCRFPGRILPFAMSPNGAATMRLSCPKIARGLAAYVMYVLAIISSHLLGVHVYFNCVSMRLYMYTCMCMHTWYIYIYICECSSACLYLQRLKREKCMRLLGHASYTSKVSPDKLEGWSPPWAHLQVRNYEWMMTDQKDQKDMVNLIIQCGLKRPHPEWSYKMGITIQFGFKSGWGSVKTSRMRYSHITNWCRTFRDTFLLGCALSPALRTPTSKPPWGEMM